LEIAGLLWTKKLANYFDLTTKLIGTFKLKIVAHYLAN